MERSVGQHYRQCHLPGNCVTAFGPYNAADNSSDTKVCQCFFPDMGQAALRTKNLLVAARPKRSVFRAVSVA
jgi:hypothetical protein